MQLKITPKLDSTGSPVLSDFVECAIVFRITLVGTWANQLWVEAGDLVRVIGTFTKQNDNHLLMDDN